MFQAYLEEDVQGHMHKTSQPADVCATFHRAMAGFIRSTVVGVLCVFSGTFNGRWNHTGVTGFVESVQIKSRVMWGARSSGEGRTHAFSDMTGEVSIGGVRMKVDHRRP